MIIMPTAISIFDLPITDDCAVCVTTNGMVKRNGHAVMGAGIAKQANELFHCSQTLGQLLTQHGNHVFDLGPAARSGPFYRLFSYPTKHDWRNPSDPALVKQSARELVALVNKMNIKTCYLPPVGCGLGGLNWNQQVKPMLESILDNRFIAVVRP